VEGEAGKSGKCSSKNVAPLLAVAVAVAVAAVCWWQLLTSGGLMDMQRIVQIIQKCWPEESCSRGRKGKRCAEYTGEHEAKVQATLQSRRSPRLP